MGMVTECVKHGSRKKSTWNIRIQVRVWRALEKEQPKQSMYGNVIMIPVNL